MADPQQPVDMADTQLTSKTPATKQKNPKRVAAGKAIAEKTRIAREAQKKALIEAQSIIANNHAKPPNPPSVADIPSSTPPSVADPASEPTKKVLTITQWLSVISIIVSLAGLYYKREEIKNVFPTPPSPVLPRAPPPSPVLPANNKIRQMD